MNLTLLLYAGRLRKLLAPLLFGSLLLAVLPVAARSQGEHKVTLSFSEVPLSRVFKGIEKQTGLIFMYNNNQIKDNYRVSIYVKKEPLEEVLRELLSPKGITWEFRSKTVVLKPEKTAAPTTAAPADSAGHVVTGEVRDQNGAPLPGAFIIVKSTQKGTISNEKGKFSLRNVPVGSLLQISYTGYAPRLVAALANTPIQVKLDVADNRLDETVVMAYGTTSRRLNTGSISKVTSEEIGRQPVSNPLAALEGRVPGMLVTQSSGAPGASVKVQIRGQNSLTNGSEPLYIIDGIPFAPNNNNINSLSSILTQGDAGLSPFSLINPSEIESIEVLKDADATAIYGSRGANGVVLITTRKPQAGKMTLNANFNTGASTSSRLPELLNTQQYLAVRREAFKNDGLTPNATPGRPGYAPDLMIWDTTRYTNMPKLLYGGTAKVLNGALSLSGGNQQTQFLIGGNFHRETTVLPTSVADNNSSIKFNLRHLSPGGRIDVKLSTIVNFDNNNLAGGSVLNMTLPPNIPELYDSTGHLNWTKGATTFQNPLAVFQTSYSAVSQNFLNNLTVDFKITDGLVFRTSAGLNMLYLNEKNKVPISTFNPSTNSTGSASFSNSNFKSFIIEPQLEYTHSIFKGKLDVLLGSTWQESRKDNVALMLAGYTSDILLGSVSAGPLLSNKLSDESKYRYEAIFTRINYTYANKYIINLNGRRDGSSRFGPDKRFANFGSVAAAWIFSNESLFLHQLNLISYGKIRSSYGITGNDQIGDYKYLSTWSSDVTPPYQGGIALKPENPFNPAFSWERNKKLEVALDLGFLHDRLLISAAYYQNKSDNQLVSYMLPSQTGFSSITQNLPALISNKGWELEMNLKIINTHNFKWTTSANLTIPTNTLLAFPDLQNSSYANIYEIGRSVNLIKAYQYTGIDTKKGTYTFNDVNKDGRFNSQDFQYGGKLDPDYFGGVTSDFIYKNFQLNLLFSFRKQFGKNIRAATYLARNYPGLMYNQSIDVFNRWQQPGDDATYEKFTATTNSEAYKQASLYARSNAVYSDASFIRLKNISISYNIPAAPLKIIGMKSARVYLQAQNLFTITDYPGDPESQSIYGIPTLKTIAGGIQLTL
ncbi:SusC/RagA family TonB-linked outer membrane protein [Chitinophaga qingshengii]|uniref:SusC/RagA family TonB-linked outer membrane protein n=1 Tax=Chitinophaga qingshengii TaxID=1569794 RepID=A0ABR7TI05_9BACT|nr:SusC/RagA family TonB-linked outer membrane protein [Chitinophaga qingshengii]MBC9929097.1 SusC/RagA family TonB-linked outer membrane protein [Chitinophaga qingshengii]